MSFCSRPSGAAQRLAATTGTTTTVATIAAVTLAAITLASAGRAQTAPGAAQPGAAEQGVPPPSAEAPPPGAPSSSGQAPAAPPAATSPPAPSGQTAAAPQQRPLARHRDSSATVAAKVNLRSGPDTNSEILTTIPAGTAVRVGECAGEWCKVIWSGHSGFAIARNLNLPGQRQAGLYPGKPGYPAEYEGYGPGYYGPPVYGAPAYYYGPRVYYYGRPWGWRRYWW